MKRIANIDKKDAASKMLNLLDTVGHCWAEFANKVNYLTYQKIGDKIIARAFDEYTNVKDRREMTIESFRMHIYGAPTIIAIGHN